LSDLVICQSDNPFGLRTKSDLFFQVTHYDRETTSVNNAAHCALNCPANIANYDHVTANHSAHDITVAGK